MIILSEILIELFTEKLKEEHEGISEAAMQEATTIHRAGETK